MFAEYTQPLTASVNPFQSLWTRASSEVAGAIVRLRQARCGLTGHALMLRFDPSRVSLQCVDCGHNTPGWTLHDHR